MSKKRNYTKKVKLQQGSNTIRTATYLNERKKSLRCNEDTIIRIEIHGIIASYINQGKNQQDIINELSKNPRYEKYNQYFEGWIRNKIEKNKKREDRQK